jgi:hypothetical protein
LLIFESDDDCARFSFILLKKTLLSVRLSENGSIFKTHLFALAVFKVNATLSSIVEAKKTLSLNFLIDESENLFLERFALNAVVTNSSSVDAILVFALKFLVLLSVTSLITSVYVDTDSRSFTILNEL